MITLWSFQALELYFVYTNLKNFYQKNLDFKKFSKNLTFGLVRSTARSTAGRAELLCRSTGRSTDMYHCACVHIGRPTGRPRARAVLSVFPSRPSRSTDREYNSLFGFHGRPSGRPLSQRSDFRPLAVDRPGRPEAENSAD